MIVPVILEEIINKHKMNIRSVIEKESKGPIEHIKVYDKYNQLLSKQAEEEVELFLKEEHTFAEYEKEVKKYNRLIDEIQYKSRKIIRVGMFELHCDELVKALSKRAENCMNKLLEKMSKDHFDINKQ
jgi:dynein heavy chain